MTRGDREEGGGEVVLYLCALVGLMGSEGGGPILEGVDGEGEAVLSGCDSSGRNDFY